jgi:GGDEF domain-containing protein
VLLLAGGPRLPARVVQASMTGTTFVISVGVDASLGAAAASGAGADGAAVLRDADAAMYRAKAARARARRALPRGAAAG